MADDITHQQLLDKIDISHEQLVGAIDTSHQQLLDAMTQQLGVITDNMATKQDVREIVREETADIRDEQLRHGILLEKMDDDIVAIAESVSSELLLKEKVNGYEKRVVALESKGKLVISTVTHHSSQIKALQTAKH
jgi:hypothetical protein